MLRRIVADRGDMGRRLDLVVRRHLADVDHATRTAVQAWIEGGQVMVNSIVVLRVAARTARGDVVTIAVPDVAPRTSIAAEPVPLDVLHEDDHLIAIDKPAGIVVHPAYRNPTGTLLNALLWRAREWPPSQRPSIVGRLDKMTSGVVLVARSAAMHAALQRTAIEKEYLAVVYGRVKRSRGRIDLRLAKDRCDRRTVVSSTTTGAPSLTRFERLARVAAPRVGLSLLRCSLVTGRTHQIRVHLAESGWPIVGDPLYGEPGWSRVSDPALAAALRAFRRQALHAWRVAFMHPVSRERLTIEAPLPSDFEALLAVTKLEPPRNHENTK